MSMDAQLTIRRILAEYVGVPAENFEMDKSLELDYDLDSTELTEIAKRVESEFGLSIDKSTRRSWESGADIAMFVGSPVAAGSVMR